jgi:hypothetical protein
MRSSRRVAVVVALFAVTACSRLAAAEPRELTAHLAWSRAQEADGCAYAKDIQLAVERRLARKVFVSREVADRLLVGRVGRGRGTFEAELVLQDEGGRRIGSRKLTSHAPSCQAMTADIALIVALLVDLPKETVELTLPAPASEPIVARPAPVQPTPVPDSKSPPDSAPSHVDVGAFAMAGYGLFPDLHGGGGLSGALSVPHAPTFEFGLKATLPTETTQAGPGARFFGASSHLLACLTIARPAGFELGSCAGAELGLLQVEGVRISQPRSSVQPLFNALADVRWLMPLGGGLFAQVGVGGTAVLRRDSFTYETADGARSEVHRPAAVVPTAQIGLVTRLPISP